LESRVPLPASVEATLMATLLGCGELREKYFDGAWNFEAIASF
jgi:hypothetical protein